MGCGKVRGVEKGNMQDQRPHSLLQSPLEHLPDSATEELCLATCTEAPMHDHGPGQRARLTPSKKVGLVLKKGGRQRRLPCCMRAPTPNQKLFSRVKLFSTTSESGLQGWGLYHS